jgi:cyclic beta-1,2-glucan synthetase
LHKRRESSGFIYASSQQTTNHFFHCFYHRLYHRHARSLCSSGTAIFIDAKQHGSFNIGAAQASISREFVQAPIQRELINIDYSIPEQAEAGVWAKEYPVDLAAGSIDTIDIRIHFSDEPQSNVGLTVELKGSAGNQRFPIHPGPGWQSTRELIDWSKIGTLSETVLLIQGIHDKKMGDNHPVTGRMQLDMTFTKLSFGQKLYVTGWGKLSGVVIISSLLGLIVAVARRKQRFYIQGFARDLLLGCAVLLIFTSVLAVYAAGQLNAFECGWISFYVTVAGVLSSLFLILAVANQSISAGEAFRNGLFPGLLAAAASNEVVWQAPDSVSGFFQLSGFGGALFVLIYHLATIYHLCTRQKTLSLISGGLIAAVPFVFGLLLAIQSFHSPVVQALLIFGTGEWIANAWSMLHRERLLRSFKIHRTIFILSVLVTLSPMIADLGSGAAVATLPNLLRPFVMTLATMLSQAPLWGIVYLFTKLILGAMHGSAPSATLVQDDALRGMKKGMIFSGVLMGLLQLIGLLKDSTLLQSLYATHPLWLLTLAGAIVFPLLKTLIETFDGSQSFFGRMVCAYQDPILYLRGCLLGMAIAIGLTMDFANLSTAQRIGIGCLTGMAVFGGVSLLRDNLFKAGRIGELKSWRYYLVESGLGAFIGAGIGFYLDAAQLPIIITKLELYNSFNLDPAEIVARCQNLRTTAPHEFTALISRWGHIKLSAATGGVKILFNEALMGVIGWGIAAPLFAINKAFLAAFLKRDLSSIKRMATRQGLVELGDGTVYVLRWGLWMAPLIFTCLRPMAEATWYNQDGLIRTFFALFNSLTQDANDFTAWSLTVFSWIIAYGGFQILIWLDHMGLRVATLVNLSFLGMDRLDQRCARFVGAEATARFIPEGVKRFTTWAPLLIPFYLPKGEQWAQVFQAGTALQAKQSGFSMGLMGLWTQIGLMAAAALLFSLCFTLRRRILQRSAIQGYTIQRYAMQRYAMQRERTFRLVNHQLAVELKSNGEINTFLKASGMGVNRCAFENVDPCGCTLFVVEVGENGAANTAWPVLGNFPDQLFTPSTFECDSDTLKIFNLSHDVHTTISITLPGKNDAAALWHIELEDRSGKARQLKVVPYIEWMLNHAAADRNHTQYNRLFPELSYSTELNAIHAFHRSSKLHGVLASQKKPSGFLTGRVDFIGRAGTLWMPRALQTLDLQTLAFREALNTEALPTFDPIGALLLDAPVAAYGKTTHTLLVSCCDTLMSSKDVILKLLKPEIDSSLREQQQPARSLKIGHGEIPPGTPNRYTEYLSNGNTLRVLTPFTPRPFDHLMANAMCHVVAVTNRGLHSSASVNAQQNRLTPDRADLTGEQVPSEAIYIYDDQSDEWFSPCFEPLKDQTAEYVADFNLDGSAVFHMKKGNIETQLTVFVPLDEPTGVYLLSIRNTGASARRLRVAPYFQMVLGLNPESAGTLRIAYDEVSGILFFENPSNDFRTGTCFVAMSERVEQSVVRRDQFFGAGRGFSRPILLETNSPGPAANDALPVAVLLTTLDIAPGEEKRLSIVLGQADTRQQAEVCAQKFQQLHIVKQSLQATRDGWMTFQSSLKIETDQPEFDAYVKWMKYQTLCERLWARKGFYQSSGAFGFRDQLQDAVNLIWVDPSLAREQLILHAAQQFTEGDTAHWFFLQQDGRTGFLSRSHASDNLLWLCWGVGEYVRMTGDKTVLDETVSYLKAETPLPPLPTAKHGMGFFPLRSPRSDSLYKHVLRAIDLVLKKRLGKNGLPLMGTGDWNDGLDEIGCEGRGESVWMAFFLVYVLKNLLPIIQERDSPQRLRFYEQQLLQLEQNIEKTWRHDRYLRAIHDDGTEIGIEGAGYWETDALGAAWAVLAGVNPERSRTALDTALRILEGKKTISLGYPPLREDTKPYLGRSSAYPEGVRENGMYSHGVQWLTRACRLLCEQFAAKGDQETAQHYRDAAVRIWFKISAIPHTRGAEIENYGGQPNQQCADYLTVHDPGRMIWSGYTGAAGWMLRQACESVVGATLSNNQVILPKDIDQPREGLTVKQIRRSVIE